MKEKSNKILGCIQLVSGRKPIIPLNDVFLNYTFMKETYWETLRKMINIFYKAYQKIHDSTSITLIDEVFSVTTEFPYYKDIDSTTPKRQDARIVSVNKIDYIEFQNDVSPEIPIAVRSIDYFGFSLTRGKRRPVSSIWLLSGTVAELLDGNTFSNYILTDEINHRPHPNVANILYVNLKQLAEEDSQAGQLAGVLIGELKTPKDPEVKQIFQSLKDSFNLFKDDTKVRDIMSIREELEAKGAARAKAELLPLLKEKDEQIEELKASLAELKALVATLIPSV